MHTATIKKTILTALLLSSSLVFAFKAIAVIKSSAQQFPKKTQQAAIVASTEENTKISKLEEPKNLNTEVTPQTKTPTQTLTAVKTTSKQQTTSNQPNYATQAFCPVNNLLQQLTKNDPKDPNKVNLYKNIKDALQNPNCSSCVTKEKYVGTLFQSAQKIFGWQSTQDLAQRTSQLIQNGLIQKKLSLYSDNACVFNKDYGYTPDLVEADAAFGYSKADNTTAGSSSTSASSSSASYSVDQADLSRIGNIYNRVLSPSL